MKQVAIKCDANRCYCEACVVKLYNNLIFCSVTIHDQCSVLVQPSYFSFKEKTITHQLNFFQYFRRIAKLKQEDVRKIYQLLSSQKEPFSKQKFSKNFTRQIILITMVIELLTIIIYVTKNMTFQLLYHKILHFTEVSNIFHSCQLNNRYHKLGF